MFLKLMAVGGMSAVLGLGAMSPRYVVDNQNDTLTFSADELNNNTFTYLASQINELTPQTQETFTNTFGNTTLTYNNETFNYSEMDEGLIYYNEDESLHINFSMVANEPYNNMWTLWEVGELEDTQLSFAYSMTINNAEWFIANIEEPVEPSSLADVLGDFVSVLIGGITELAEGIASGVVAMASALFLEYDDGVLTGLSTFGGIVAIFAGLALAVGVTTKVYTWVTSLGN